MINQIIISKKEIEKKNTMILSLIFIISCLVYVMIISLIINILLNSFIEPIYLLFKGTTATTLEFWLGTLGISIIYTLINIIMVYFAYKTTFFKWRIKNENKTKFLVIVGIIFPIILFTTSYMIEKEFFPLILNTISQMIITILYHKNIKQI